MIAAELSALAQERSQAYWLLSLLFLNVPDAQHLQDLRKKLGIIDERGALAELRREIDAALRAPDTAAMEFTRRLGVVGMDDDANLPYESFAREGTMPGRATVDVRICMSDAGFADIADDAPAPDHIGAELKFMALLCFEESRAWSDARPAEALQLISRQWNFLSQHLAAWAPEYCRSLEARAQHGYVKAVARLARQCVRDDAEAIEEYFIRVSMPHPGARAAGPQGSVSLN